jgi:hypothetical protein
MFSYQYLFLYSSLPCVFTHCTDQCFRVFIALIFGEVDKWWIFTSCNYFEPPATSFSIRSRYCPHLSKHVFSLGWHDKHIAKMQRSQSEILCMITNAPWYVTNQTLHDDLKVSFIKDVVQDKSIINHDKLGNHSNPILQPLLEQQQRRRLKILWPAGLIDGWRGFTHRRGPHHDIIGTGGRCLTQHISLKNVVNSDY